jgi:hypothetical protein
MKWVMISTSVFQLLGLLWCVGYLLPKALRARRRWNKINDELDRGSELFNSGVEYSIRKMPKNATACFRSANENLLEVDMDMNSTDVKLF